MNIPFKDQQLHGMCMNNMCRQLDRLGSENESLLEQMETYSQDAKASRQKLAQEEKVVVELNRIMSQTIWLLKNMFEILNYVLFLIWTQYTKNNLSSVHRSEAITK